MTGRYRDDPKHPSRLNKQGRPEPTRQPRFGNRLYCMVWTDHDLFKVGLSSGRNARDNSAVQAMGKYFGHEGVMPGSFIEWRAEVPAVEGAAWGDCQRLEMVFATAIKRRLGASAAAAVGLEWLTRENLDNVAWRDELTAAATKALQFSGLDSTIDWEEYTPLGGGDSGSSHPRIHGPAQLDAHRTMRNKRGVCAMKSCGVSLSEGAVLSGPFRYCSVTHAERDAQSRSASG